MGKNEEYEPYLIDVKTTQGKAIESKAKAFIKQRNRKKAELTKLNIIKAELVSLVRESDMVAQGDDNLIVFTIDGIKIKVSDGEESLTVTEMTKRDDE